MAKLYLIFMLCALTSADNPSKQRASFVTHDTNGLPATRSSDTSSTVRSAGSSSLSRTSSSSGNGDEQTSYVSQSGAVRSGSEGSNSYTQQQAYSGSTNAQGRTGNERDHNGLSENEVQQLVAEGNRRRLLGIYNSPLNRARKISPQRYSLLSPPRPYTKRPLFGRNGEEADSNGSNSGSANANSANREGSENVSPKTDSSASGQEPEGSRRSYFPDDYNNNPFSRYFPNDIPYDPYSDFNPQNYLDAFGQFGNYIN